MNNTHHLIRRRIQTPLVVLPLLALLLAFLSSFTYQYAAETHLNHGFISTLDHLVVASPNESVRALGGTNDDDGAAADGDRDLPQGWSNGSTSIWIGQRDIGSVSSVETGDLPLAGRYVIPLLRAPPLT